MKESTFELLGNITGYTVIHVTTEFACGCATSFIGKFCWNHLIINLVTKFNLPTVSFVDAIAVYGLIWCVLTAVRRAILPRDLLKPMDLL